MTIKISPNRKVETNPRPPNEPKIGNAKKVAGAQPGNSAAAKQKKAAQPSAALRSAAQGISSTNFSGVHAAGTPIAPLGASDPRDATYWETLSSLEFSKNKELENLHTEGVFDETSHNREKAELERLEPNEQRNLREGANVAGEIYSSATTNAANELGLQQSNKRSALEEAYQKLLFQRAKEKEGVEGNFNLGAREDYEKAVERAVQARSEEPGPELPEQSVNVNITPSAKTKAAKPQNAPAGKKWAWNGSQWHLVKV